MDTLNLGNCDKLVERYYYDVIEKKCKKFYFSGCLGNRNNFLNYEECSAICLKEEHNSTVNLILKASITQNSTSQPLITTTKIAATSSNKTTSFISISLPTVSLISTQKNNNDCKFLFIKTKI